MFNNNRGNTFVTQPAGNIFGTTNNNTPNTNLFGVNRNNTTPNNATNNIFGQNNNTNTNTNAGIFGQQNNNNNNNAMGQQGTGMFNNTNTGNNIFGNNTNNNNNNTPFAQNNNPAPLFNQNNQNNNTPQPNQGGLFTPNNQQTPFNQNNQNMFNQNRPNNNFFPNNQNNPVNTFPQPMVGGNPPFGQNPMNNFNLMALLPDQQQRFVKEMTNDQIRKYIDHCLKSLIDVKKLDLLTVGNDNQLKNEKMNKTANTYNIKKEVLYVKKEVNDKLVTPLKNLKNKDKEIFNASAELAFKVAEKLQKYKERLIEAISQKKMIEDIKRQIDDIDNQIKEFLKPLFNSHQTRNSFSFIDPDQFCIRVSEQILKNIAYLDNKMDELLACEGEAPQQVVDTGDVIQMLVEYYQNVVISLREYSEKYHKQKKEVLSKRRMGNTDQTLRRIMEKANVSVGKQLKAYELVKQIESVLLQREKRMSQQMSLQ